MDIVLMLNLLHKISPTSRNYLPFVSTGGRDNDVMGVNYAGLAVPAFQAIKELIARVELFEKIIQNMMIKIS